MKWIGQHIWDFISRFRSTVYLENLETSSNENVLVVDSDGKVTKNTSLGGSDLTLTNETNNRVVTSTGGTGLNAEANMTFDGNYLNLTALTSTFTNAVTSQVVIKNTGNNSSGGILDLINERGTGVDGDTAGLIRFYGDDDGGNATLVADVMGEIIETADGSETGSLKAKIKTGLAGGGSAFRDGLILSTTAGNDIINARIGYGVTSLTTIEGDLDIDGDNMTSAGAMTFTPAGKYTITAPDLIGDVFHLDADADTNNIVNIDTGKLDIDASSSIEIDGTNISIDGVHNSNLTVTGSNKDLDIAVAGGSTQELRLASAGTGASALHLNASAGSVDIDSADNVTIDAADEITLTTTSADGHISLVSAHTAGQAIHLDGDAASGSIVDIDAGTLEIDSTLNTTITAGGILNLQSSRNKINKIYNFTSGLEFEDSYDDDEASGTILKYSPGNDDTLNGSEIHYLSTAGRWAQANADSTCTDCGNKQLLGVGLGNARLNGVLLEGFVQVSSDEILNVPGSGEVDGLPVYISTTLGHFDFTAPSGSGDFVRIVGYAIDDDSSDVLIYFKPDNTWVEIA